MMNRLYLFRASRSHIQRSQQIKQIKPDQTRSNLRILIFVRLNPWLRSDLKVCQALVVTIVVVMVVFRSVDGRANRAGRLVIIIANNANTAKSIIEINIKITTRP
jgi:hypothetical protein